MFKKLFFFSLSVAFLLGCETKFSVNGEYVETPIVHFLLDQGQEFQFLKLNRTFLQEGNANDFAKDAELSYFDNVVATVEEIKNGSTLRTWVLQDTVINNKEDGVFYGPEQKLYFFKPDPLDPNPINGKFIYLDEDAFYRLSIDIDNGTHMIQGQTELIKGINITYPSTNLSLNFADNDVIQNGYKNSEIRFSTTPDAAVFNAKLRFDYKEVTASEQVVKSVFMDLGEKINDASGASTASYFANGERFYELLQERIEVDPNVIRREVDGVEIILTAGSQDLYTYILTNEPSSTLAQNKPTYSNVDGALGIFSARSTVTQYKPDFSPASNTRALNQNSTKELSNGQYTAALGFCSSIPNDIPTTFYCN